MITSVSIEGFKSFGSPAKPVELGPLNFIVGANASGKTNFVSALKFLHLAMTEGLEKTVARPEFDGLWGIRNYMVFSKKNSTRRGSKPLAISIRIKGPFPEQPISDTRTFHVESASYRLEIGFDDKTSRPFVAAEKFEAQIRTPTAGHATYSLNRSEKSLEIRDPLNSERPEHSAQVPASVRTRLSVEEWSFGLPALWFHQWVSHWRFFGIIPNVARAVARESSQVELGPEGENLAAILHLIEKQNGQSCLPAILSGVRGAVPDVQRIKTLRLESGDQWTFQVVEKRIRALSPAAVSDGTIRLLTLMVVLCWSSKNSSLLVIEEPENNLHPHLCEQLVATFRAVSEERQIIATTHSPGFLDYLELKELLLCERDAKTHFTVLVPAGNKENVDVFRRRFSLGELWVQGMLGGIPQ
jgi:predicted ATPase